LGVTEFMKCLVFYIVVFDHVFDLRPHFLKPNKRFFVFFLP